MRIPYWPVVPLSLGFAVPALATPTVQTTHGIYACVDPRATTALAIPDGRLRNQKWVDYVHRTGHCFALPADQTLSVLARQGPLMLVRSTATSDMPPVYAQASDVEDAADVPAASTAATDAQPPPAPAAPSETVPEQTAPPSTVSSTTVPAATLPAATPSTTPPAPSASPADTAPPPPPPATTPQAGPAATPPSSPADSAAPVTAPLGTPAPTPAPVRSSGISLLLVVLVVLALLGLVAVAVAIARQQRRFAHVEGRNWPPEDDGRDPLGHAQPVAPQPSRPVRSVNASREECIAVLKQGGWQIQPSFTAAGADGDAAPDIVGRKQNAVLAVRCHRDGEPVTHAIIDEAATMGRLAGAHVTVLVSNSPMTQRAHDEALRLHVHVLAAQELVSLSA